ncbi:MAG: hypothetical protein JST00_13745 [Deltaproteobacteria bacterium]|nr:hypothetical protein [Deltaproteobacteria bacterium]
MRELLALPLALSTLVLACSAEPAAPPDPREGAPVTLPSGGGGSSASSSSTSSSGGSTTGPCTTLVPSRRPTWVDSFFGAAIYTELTSTLDPGYEDAIGIRLRTGVGYLDDIPRYEQTPGTFDLADPIEHDYRTCRHCVFALVDVSGDHIQHLYLAQSGTLELTFADVDTGEFAGSLKNARLVEIAATGYYAWEGPFADSGCLSIPDLAFDTRAVPGGSCRDAEDCPNAKALRCVGGVCTR